MYKQPKTTSPNLSDSDKILKYLDSLRQDEIKRAKNADDEVKNLLGEDTAVIFNGKPIYNLNARIVLKQGLDVSELRDLKLLHAEKLKYFDLMSETENRAKLKEYAQQIERIEFGMQKAWHFPEDKNFHEWYKVPKCTCPKLDNADFRGTDRRIINMDCPVHGE